MISIPELNKTTQQLQEAIELLGAFRLFFEKDYSAMTLADIQNEKLHTILRKTTETVLTDLKQSQQLFEELYEYTESLNVVVSRDSSSLNKLS